MVRVLLVFVVAPVILISGLLVAIPLNISPIAGGVMGIWAAGAFIYRVITWPKSELPAKPKPVYDDRLESNANGWID